jgi:hypothetical protein
MNLSELPTDTMKQNVATATGETTKASELIKPWPMVVIASRSFSDQTGEASRTDSWACNEKL